ncbi:MAG: DUF2207 domain-containing protein [Xanthobacteraceae bacterium]
MRTARLLVAVLLLACVAVRPAFAVEHILRFVSDVTVGRDGDLEVVETIRVKTEQYGTIKHGILRDFPTTYTRPDGSRVVVGFSVQSVTLDGANEPWTTEGLANGMRVRIGSAATTLSVGEHEFVIRYRTTRQIGFFPDYDELYWNATGNAWTFTIDVAEAHITLPEPVPFKQTAAYTGPQGAIGRDAAIVGRQPGVIVFQTTRPLPPNSGLTVAASWQKGVVTAPTSTQEAQWWLADNLPATVAGFGLIGVLAFYVFAWLWVGRGPPRGTIIPLFAPPEGMSAAGVRYVERMRFDDRCFTAAIIDLAVKGHLRLTGRGSETVIWRRDGGKPIAPPESAAKSRLFGADPSIALTQVNYRPLASAKRALMEGLRQSYDGKLFNDNYAWSGFGLVLVIALLGVTGLLIATIDDGNRAGALIFGGLLPVFPIIGGVSMIRTGLRSEKLRKLQIAIGLILIVLFAATGRALTATVARGPIDFLPLIATFILGPLGLFGFQWLHAPTAAGRAIMDRIEGFREYLGVAEESRLNALNPPDKTPELFEQFLPYAIALDVEVAWATRFAGVLAAAATGAALGAWYQANQWTNDPVGFSHELGSTLASTVASASSPPGSGDGGSGGGGSSGGGGGGGGGSGW